MRIELTSEYEKRRMSKPRVVKTWEYFSSPSLFEVVERAREMGWKDHKVQVRRVSMDGWISYYIEPYEDDCNCPNIVPPF